MSPWHPGSGVSVMQSKDVVAPWKGKGKADEGCTKDALSLVAFFSCLAQAWQYNRSEDGP
jgi:hypothetical protein